MTTKAAVVRENITIDQESMQWTCNQCFNDRIEKPGMENKPLKAYAYTGTSNIARHFDEFHKEMFQAALVKVEQYRREMRISKRTGSAKKPPKKIIRISAKPDNEIHEEITHNELSWAEEEDDEEEGSQTSILHDVYTVDPPPQQSQPNTSNSVAEDFDDPLKIFFDAMYASVRKMARPDILHIRRKLFDMVSEVEELQEYQQIEETHE